MLPTYYTISGESQEKPQLSLRFEGAGLDNGAGCPLIADESSAFE